MTPDRMTAARLQALEAILKDPRHTLQQEELIGVELVGKLPDILALYRLRERLEELKPELQAEVKSWEDAAAESPGGDRGEAHDISTVKLLDRVVALLLPPAAEQETTQPREQKET